MDELLFRLYDFLETGGPVLWGILFLCLLLWTVILERFWFILRVYPKRASAWVRDWESRPDKASWRSRKIRLAIISRAGIQLRQSLPLIKALIALGPLFGLLGTVTGMIDVFDVLALTGETDARLMASGISAATITTMAGLVVALTGIYPSMSLARRSKRAVERLAEALK